MICMQTFVFVVEWIYSVGYFQAPTDGGDGQNGPRESSESGRQRQRDPNFNIDAKTTLQENSLENRMKEVMAAAASVEKTTEEEVPVDPADLEHYTPPGTPQELSPVNDQQIADMVADLEKVEVKNQEPKQENPKRKPEQQHYQPPRAARTNSQRTDSWRSNASGNSQVQDEQPKLEAPRIDSEIKTPVKEESVESGSNTPTTRATPVPVELKPEALAVCKRDGAHLPRFCKKFVEKENTEFKKLEHYFVNLSTEKKSKLVIRDFGSHQQFVLSSTNPQVQEMHASFLKNLVVEQLKWAQKDRRRFDEERFVNEHQLSCINTYGGAKHGDNQISVPVEYKPEAPTVSMIIPLVPVETEKKAVKKEYCAYCNILGKPMQTITSHSLFSSDGVPICPTFREDYEIEIIVVEEVNQPKVNFWGKIINFFKVKEGVMFADEA